MTWIVVALALVGNICIIKRHAFGFWFWLFADCYFLTHNILSSDYPQAMIFSLYVLMALYGLYSWSKDDANCTH